MDNTLSTLNDNFNIYIAAIYELPITWHDKYVPRIKMSLGHYKIYPNNKFTNNIIFISVDTGTDINIKDICVIGLKY